MSLAIQVLLLHGCALLLLGNLCGIPFGRAIARRRPEDTVRAWRVAHSGNTAGGATMIASASALAVLHVGERLEWLVAAPLIASALGFGIALPIGAALGIRGILTGRTLAERLLFLGNATGALGALTGSATLLLAVAVRVSW